MKKIIKIIIILLYFQSSYLVAKATTHNDIWHTALPTSSSTTTFKSTSYFQQHTASKQPYSPKNNARSTTAYSPISSYRGTIYRSSDSKMQSYGNHNNIQNNNYDGIRYKSAYSPNTTHQIAAKNIEFSPIAVAPYSISTGSTLQKNYVRRGVGEPTVDTDDLDIGDTYKGTDGKWYTWTGDGWIASHTEPEEEMPLGELPITLMILLLALYIFKHRKATMRLENF